MWMRIAGAAAILLQLSGLAAAEEGAYSRGRKPQPGEIEVSRESKDGQVRFFLNNGTDRIFCVYVVGRTTFHGTVRSAVPIWLEHETALLLLPHEQHKGSASTYIVSTSDGTVPSWSADIRFLVARVPGISERPSTSELARFTAEVRRDLQNRCNDRSRVIYDLDPWR